MHAIESLLVSIGVVALAEVGDKTQLLAFILAARFKKPLPIIAGILCATLVNHGLAGALGAWITANVSAQVLRWVLGLSFIGMAVWTLVPDKIENEETLISISPVAIFEFLLLRSPILPEACSTNSRPS